MSGYTDNEAMNNFEALGFRAAVPKTFTSDLLASTLAQAMAYRPQK